MDFTFHRPHKLELQPVEFAPPRPTSLFQLRMLFRDGGNWQYRELVHVPVEVQQAFRDGAVTGLHLETLGMNALPSRLLPESPQFAVLAVELADGSRVECIPVEFRSARLRRFTAAGALGAIGIGAAFTPFAWLGGLIAGVATHLVRSGLSLRAKPFWPPPRCTDL